MASKFYADSFCNLQVKFPLVMFINSITTKGGMQGGGFIKQYVLNVSTDGVSYTNVQNADGGNVFAGNADTNTPVSHPFKTTVLARYVRLEVVNFHTAVSLRWMLTGCPALSTLSTLF